jgi:3-polyprenyl-4-hydroxybenzoate decarboxylase
VISGSLGAILDPSASEQGLTAKIGIDATRPFGQAFAEKLLMSPEKVAWARELVDRLPIARPDPG